MNTRTHLHNDEQFQRFLTGRFCPYSDGRVRKKCGTTTQATRKRLLVVFQVAYAAATFVHPSYLCCKLLEFTRLPPSCNTKSIDKQTSPFSALLQPPERTVYRLHHRPQERVNIMIPQISQAPASFNWCLIFCKSWSNKVLPAYGDKLCRSSDNVDRQQYLPILPDAVVFPRSTADVALIARLPRRNAIHR